METPRLSIRCQGAGLLPLDSINEFQKDMKALSDRARKQLRHEIEATGFAFPIHVWVSDGSNFCIGGHQRIRVLRDMRADGWDIPELPVVFVHADSYQEAKRRVLQDVAQYGALELPKLKDFMIDAGMEFKDLKESFKLPDVKMPKLAKLFADSSGSAGENSVPAAPESSLVNQGDAFSLGSHALMCGDSANPEDVQKLLGGALADMVFTDPPWNVNYGAVDNPAGWKNRPRTIMNDHMDEASWDRFVSGIASALKIGTKPGAPLYCVMSAQEWPSVDRALRSAGFHWSSTIIWAKDRLVMSRKDYHTQYEPIWYGWNDGASRLKVLEDRSQTDLWQCDRPHASELHPTMKPIELVERAVVNSSNPGDIILDLFGGSGSTMIACEKAGRRNFSMELDPKYCAVIIQRWADFTGKQPFRVNPDGSQTSWAEILAAPSRAQS